MTIYFEIDVPKNVYMTLAEKTTIENANYMLHTINKENESNNKLMMINDSFNLIRFNIFEMTVSSTSDILSANTLSLLPGEHTYYVYQTTATTASDSLIISNNLVESGLFIVERDIDVDVNNYDRWI